MTRSTNPLRRARLLAAATALAVLVPLVPAGAAPAPTIGEEVARGLVRVDPGRLLADDSSTTGCMTTDPEPLVYATDMVVLREPDLSLGAALDAVDTALDVIGSSASAVKARRISFPAPSPAPGERAEQEPVTPVIYVTITDEESGDPVPIVTLTRRLRAAGVTAAPSYGLSPTDGPLSVWPDGYPQAATAADLVPPRTGLGKEVTVAIFDAGVPPVSDAAVPANLTPYHPSDREEMDRVRPLKDVVDLYFGGHAVPMAGVIGTLAPEVTMKGARITMRNGIATDVSATIRMAKALRRAEQLDAWPQLIVNAFGTPACEAPASEGGALMVPLGLQAVADAVRQHQEALLVASSGNRSSTKPFYPAAFVSVVAVGALDTTKSVDGTPWSAPSRSGPVAEFSNDGSYVDAWAPGVHLAVPHVDGLRFPGEPFLGGAAFVNGTSFAAPYLVGLLAEEIAASGSTPLDAWRTLRRSGTDCATVTGTAVALTDLADSATTRPTGPAEC